MGTLLASRSGPQSPGHPTKEKAITRLGLPLAHGLLEAGLPSLWDLIACLQSTQCRSLHTPMGHRVASIPGSMWGAPLQCQIWGFSSPSCTKPKTTVGLGSTRLHLQAGKGATASLPLWSCQRSLQRAAALLCRCSLETAHKCFKHHCVGVAPKP